MFGQYGSLNKKNGKAQCHLCGKWFLNVGLHIARGHKIACADYRERFGLSRCYALAGDDFINRQRENHSERLRTYRTRGREMIVNMSPEERSRIGAISSRKSTRIKNSKARVCENSAARLQCTKRVEAVRKAQQRPEYRKKISDIRKRWNGNTAHMEKMRELRWAQKEEGE